LSKFSVQSLQRRIRISFLPSHEMVINAEAADGSSPRRVLSMVADSYTAYVWQLKGTGWYHKHPPALLYVVPATPRSRSTDVIETSGLGALFGALVGAAVGAVALIPPRRRPRMA
jgi:hypothetical protein